MKGKAMRSENIQMVAITAPVRCLVTRERNGYIMAM